MLKKLNRKNKINLLNMQNKIHKPGFIPEDFGILTINLLKKANAKNCTDYRTISLMSNTLKLVLAIMNRRTERKIDDHLRVLGQEGNEQDAVVLFKMLIQKALTVNRKVYV